MRQTEALAAALKTTKEELIKAQSEVSLLYVTSHLIIYTQ
jgi:hypothetical protein